MLGNNNSLYGLGDYVEVSLEMPEISDINYGNHIKLKKSWGLLLMTLPLSPLSNVLHMPQCDCKLKYMSCIASWQALLYYFTLSNAKLF